MNKGVVNKIVQSLGWYVWVCPLHFHSVHLLRFASISFPLLLSLAISFHFFSFRFMSIDFLSFHFHRCPFIFDCCPIHVHSCPFMSFLCNCFHLRSFPFLFIPFLVLSWNGNGKHWNWNNRFESNWSYMNASRNQSGVTTEVTTSGLIRLKSWSPDPSERKWKEIKGNPSIMAQ